MLLRGRPVYKHPQSYPGHWREGSFSWDKLESWDKITGACERDSEYSCVGGGPREVTYRSWCSQSPRVKEPIPDREASTDQR